MRFFQEEEGFGKAKKGTREGFSDERAIFVFCRPVGSKTRHGFQTTDTKTQGKHFHGTILLGFSYLFHFWSHTSTNLQVDSQQ